NGKEKPVKLFGTPKSFSTTSIVYGNVPELLVVLIVIGQILLALL
ncbi:hypothetical protein SAMN05216225_101373, partial [Ornithinibacillus halophilus]